VLPEGGSEPPGVKALAEGIVVNLAALDAPVEVPAA
jgi:hypothetical protein